MNDTREPVRISDMAVGDLFVVKNGNIYIRGQKCTESELKKPPFVKFTERIILCPLYDLYECEMFGWAFDLDDLVHRPNEDDLAQWKLHCDGWKEHFEKNRRCLTFMQAAAEMKKGKRVRRSCRLAFAPYEMNDNGAIVQAGFDYAAFFIDDIEAIDWEIVE